MDSQHGIPANIPGEEAPTKRAIQERIGGIKKGVRDHGVAAFFSNNIPIPRKSRRSIAGPGEQRTPLTGQNELNSATASGLQYAAEHGGPAIKDEVPSTSTIKQEARDETINAANEARAVTHPDLGTSISQAHGLHEQVRSIHKNGAVSLTGDGKYTKQYLVTPPKTPGRGGRPSAVAKSNGRKRHRSDTDLDSDSVSMTTETTPSAASLTAPKFDMNLRPDHRNLNLYESDDASDDTSDDAWVPGVEEGRGRGKRVRRH